VGTDQGTGPVTAAQTARDQILARIRAATGAGGSTAGGAGEQARVAGAAGARASGAAAEQASSVTEGAPADIDAAYAALPREYLRAHHDADSRDIADLFAERVADYRAVVERVPESGLAAAIARALAARSAEAGPAPFVTPAGLPANWLAGLPATIELAGDEPPLSAARLDQTAGVITSCAVAIAETGTIILDHGPGQGRRLLTLVPDFHLVVVQADQVAADLADAFAQLDPARPHTLISGPSATSDIELIRVEGVHGPRNLHVLLTSPELP
jgi:L-lactate dehydrogenase complex protein LldG